MYPDSPYAIPIGSFRGGVTPPTVDANAPPVRYIAINCDWFPYIIGALKQLLLQATWNTSDPDTLNLIQMRVFTLMSLFDCEKAPTLHDLCGSSGITEEEFQMPLRVDCDCNVFVTCCDGTEKQILTSDQVKALLASQPGSATTPPASGGGCQTYHGTMGAKPWYLPASVSSGDTILIDNTDGAWNDGVESGWHCFNGNEFFNTRCLSVTSLDGTDPVPTSPHMCIVARIGSNYYDVSHGIFTVPGGISNEAVTFQANDTSLDSDSGTITFDVTVCNNQPANWSLPQNLALAPDDWTAAVPGVSGTQSSWSAGNGWVSDACNNMLGTAGRYNIVLVDLIFDHATTLEHMDCLFDMVAGDNADGTDSYVLALVGSTPTTLITKAPVSGSNQTMTWSGSIAGVTSIRVVLNAANHNDGTCPPSGNATLKQMNLSGVGTSPF